MGRGRIGLVSSLAKASQLASLPGSGQALEYRQRSPERVISVKTYLSAESINVMLLLNSCHGNKDRLLITKRKKLK